MDSTLVGVTLISMTMASALSAIVWRMLRVERRRSDARVIALAELAVHEQPVHVAHREPVVHHEGLAHRESAAHRERVAQPPSRAVSPARDLTLRDTRVAGATIFAEREPSSSPWGTRIAVMSGLALAVAAVVLFGLAARERGEEATPRQVTRPDAATLPAAPEIELLSLHDTRQPGTLTITGLVQNPRGGAMLTRVTVTAFAFDESGAFLASGRALLDITALAPGDESPFVVTVPVSENVARYRVGFRGDDGRVIAHIDRRQQGAVADAVTRGAAGI
ncbi:MAG: hypothetical protein DMF84_18585 [Acidobacteria bacterium]|nr:MAG: hypothetical protein DMF84_18585 [Acidobacteriota bacterium]